MLPCVPNLDNSAVISGTMLSRPGSAQRHALEKIPYHRHAALSFQCHAFLVAISTTNTIRLAAARTSSEATSAPPPP